MSERIAEPLTQARHEAAMSWVNRLIIDLRLQMSGVPPCLPITPERLDQWYAHYRNLERCRESDRAH